MSAGRNNIECWGCSHAAKDPRTHSFTAGCFECDARAVANCQEFNQATSKLVITTAYKQLLCAIFGDKWLQGHNRAKEWAQKIIEAK